MRFYLIPCFNPGPDPKKTTTMIMSTEREIILQKSYDKILHIQPTLNKTLTFLASRTFNK